MKKTSLISLFLILVCSIANAASDNKYAHVPYYRFDRYQITNGLTDNSITCIAQDRYGFIWIGKNDGFCRYDGYHFSAVPSALNTEILSESAEAIMVDREGLIWFSTKAGKGYYDSTTGEVTTISLDTDIPISKILQDSDGNIWFCSNDLFRYDHGTGQIIHYPSGGFNFISEAVDSEGQIWCTCSDGRMLRYDTLVDKFKEEKFLGMELIVPVSDSRLLASTVSGDVLLLNTRDGSSSVIFSNSKESDKTDISCMLERVHGEFWIGTNSGILVYNENTDIRQRVIHSDSESMSISSDDIRCIFSDNEGNIWAGTQYDGLNLWRNNGYAYSLLYHIDSDRSLTGNTVRAVSLQNGLLWVGTEDGGMNYTHTYEHYFHHVSLPENRNNYRDILPVGNELWISTFGNGIFRYDPQKNSVIRHYQFAGNQFKHQIITQSGEILVSSTSGVYKYIQDSDSFELITDTDGYDISSLREDSTGKIWAGTTGKGIMLLDKEFHKIGSLCPDIHVTSLYEDRSGRMWATTDGDGTYLIDIKQRQPVLLSSEAGFSSGSTRYVIEDNDGMIWLASDNGLYLVDPSDCHVTTTFFRNNITQTIQFTDGAALDREHNALFMGTAHGLLSFYPSRMKAFTTDKNVYISSIKGIFGDRMTDLNEKGLSAMFSKRIVTSYKNANSLRIRFSCMDFSSPVSHMYRYSLSSRHGSISDVTDDRAVVLYNVGYGRHTFTVSLEGSDAPESTKTVIIVIRPPLYKSTFARILEVMVLIGIISFIVSIYVNSRKKERQRRMEKLEEERQKELYESKNSFFMNITHEIRTPLSLIKMPIDNMVSSGKISMDDLKTVQANANRLLDLTNQLLDIRKLEQKEEKLEFSRYNLSDVVRRTAEWFRSMANDQGVQLDVTVPDNAVDSMCIHDSVEKIVSNLITNALKYGKDKISVSLVSDEEKAIIRIDSNGEMIPAKNRERIFVKFVHGGKGTGLGLALAKTLAERQGGKLYLDTTRTEVNSFVLELPLRKPENIQSDSSKAIIKDQEEQTGNDLRKSILLVEDDQDFRLYLAETLAKEYNILTAANGRMAIEKLEKEKIDLIISDIMMPVMDGCELCNYVKTNVEYSHIPVILLTAAIGMETRIATLQVGADSYIEKPFPMELLNANISNLFKNREIANQQFSKSPLAQFKGASSNKMDEELMEKLHGVMLEKMSDSTLSINDLSSAMNISNSTLFRKIKANTGLNINEYIKISRLKRAAELLATGQYRINEVADMTGFSSASYFSASFQKQFNISPSAFVKSLSSKKD